MTAPNTAQKVDNYHIAPLARVGHVHLRVADLERSIAFYQNVLGLHTSQDMRTESPPRKVAFLSANNYHHYVALAEFSEVTAPTSRQAGLFHVAFLYPNRRELARALKHIMDCGYPVDSCHEYGIGEAVNLRDPDGIPLELYWDRLPEEWPRVDNELRIFNKRIDPSTILAELDNEQATRA